MLIVGADGDRGRRATRRSGGPGRWFGL